jgi:predicted lipid-binding transport protein (Tim44 family)
MKSWIVALSLAIASVLTFTPSPADAKRLGSGGSSGMQRNMPARAAPDAAPARPAQATPNTPPTAGAAPAAPRRSWMGPLAGLAAGLGIAALMSHLGMGEEFGNMIMMVLLAGLAFVAIRFVMSRMRAAQARPAMAGSNGMQFAGAPAGANAPWLAGSSSSGSAPEPAPLAPAAPVMPAAFAASPIVPVGFDQEGFERIAKMIFIRLQAANDSADLNDLRQFTTPEMFAAIKLDLQDRSSTAVQHTDVVRVDAEVADFSDEAERQVVSVRFHGLIREEEGGEASAFNEIWHLVKPLDGSREWAIAGIQQTH